MNKVSFLTKILTIGSILFGSKSYASSTYNINGDNIDRDFSFYEDDNKIEIQNDEGNIIVKDGGDKYFYLPNYKNKDLSFKAREIIFSNFLTDSFSDLPNNINILAKEIFIINQIKISEHYSFFNFTDNFTLIAKNIEFSDISGGNNLIHLSERDETTRNNPNWKGELNIEATGNLLFKNIATAVSVFYVNGNKTKIKGKTLTIEGGNQLINSNYFYNEGALEIDISERTEISKLNIEQSFIATYKGDNMISNTDKLRFGNLNFTNNNVYTFYATSNSAELNRNENKIIIANNNFLPSVLIFSSPSKCDYSDEPILINGSYDIINNNIKIPYGSVFTLLNRSKITLNAGDNGHFNIDKNGDIPSFMMIVKSNVLKNKAKIATLNLIGNNSTFKFGGKGIVFRKITVGDNTSNDEEEETPEQIEKLISIPVIDDLNPAGGFRINVGQNIIFDIPSNSIIEAHEINFEEGSKLKIHIEGNNIGKSSFIKFAGGKTNGGYITGKVKVEAILDNYQINDNITEMGFEIIDKNFNIDNLEFIPEINSDCKLIKNLVFNKDLRMLLIEINNYK